MSFSITTGAIKELLYAPIYQDSLSTNEKKALAPFVAGAESIVICASPLFEGLNDIYNCLDELAGCLQGKDGYTATRSIFHLLRAPLKLPVFFLQLPLIPLSFAYTTLQILIDPEKIKRNSTTFKMGNLEDPEHYELLDEEMDDEQEPAPLEYAPKNFTEDSETRLKTTIYSPLQSEHLSQNEKKLLAPLIAGSEAIILLASPVFEGLNDIYNCLEEFTGWIQGKDDYTLSKSAVHLLRAPVKIFTLCFQSPLIPYLFLYKTAQIILDPGNTSFIGDSEGPRYRYVDLNPDEPLGVFQEDYDNDE